MAARVWRGSTFNGPAECRAWEGIELGLDGSRRLRWDAINLPVTTVRFWPTAIVQQIAASQTDGVRRFIRWSDFSARREPPLPTNTGQPPTAVR